MTRLRLARIALAAHAISLLPVALQSLALAQSGNESSHEVCAAGSSCPQTAPGWVLYMDPNRPPDFWWRPSVDIDEIVVCPHGLNFAFVEKQAGQDFLMSLILIKPTPALVEERRREGYGHLSPAEAFDLAQSEYSNLVAELSRISMGVLSADSRVSFRDPLDGMRSLGTARPRLVPWRLTLVWRGTEVSMKGYLDLYLNMPS